MTRARLKEELKCHPTDTRVCGKLETEPLEPSICGFDGSLGTFTFWSNFTWFNLSVTIFFNESD
jgi:hypothetical protein